jgi:steroid delta-isomerase-like uncharacterized protein
MDPKDVILNFYADWNRKDAEALLSYFTDDSEITEPGGVDLHGLQGAETYYRTYQDAYPDNELTIHNILAEGDCVALEATFDGTQTGTFTFPDGEQVPPTGRHVNVPYATFFIVSDGKIVTLHLYYDQMEARSQLGLTPEAAASAIEGC